MADHLRTELVSGALANTVAARDPEPGVIFHSGRGLSSTPPPPTPPSPPTAGCANLVGADPASRRTTPWQEAATSLESRLTDTGAWPAVARPAGGRGIHRLVQRHPAAFLTRIS